MADVAVATQLKQWSFDKPATSRPEPSDSTALSPDLSHHEPETLRIDAAAVHDATSMDSQDASTFQERYLSSEEDLSPMDGNSTDDDAYDSEVSIHDAEARPSYLKARTMSISRWDKGKSCDMAVIVSFVSAGRPKMIELATWPVQETPQRSSSLAQLPIVAISKLRQQDQMTRHSLIVNSSINRSISPALSIDTRRPSTGSGSFTHSNKSDSRSRSSLQSGISTSRSSSSSVSEKSTSSARPVSSAGLRKRSSLYIGSSARNINPLAPLPPLTPQSPAPHAFLSSDPYEYGNSTTNAASPIIKSAPHKRLRSISMKLSLAKIAITPSVKKWDSMVNGRAGNMPPTPSTPCTPMTPQTAPLPTPNKLRRNSRMLTRPSTARGPSPDIPPLPTTTNPSPRKLLTKKMVARGADERMPIIELPPCPAVERPGSAVGSLKPRRIRKRKSLMDLL